ncbi:hypothetical protein VTN96DRAFT_6486 [Rasamsonia emersonii]|uniref:PDCD2 C domain protein n=1 Tax=Rasamsonia emersonii (strain ATCC 16479 / CBS 393.64 / IMI 116815) TaxID=1408163 RepID=A0A0F4YVU5_RASE3|nr:PDCD2 C domain protein [Rasamsonia emersonii CBS 393.64]KKA21976.1 PDCD2 C domain protein [Rasamsonia emersonii CBS 393.64]
MDPYDSDSSGLEDAGDYTETGVLLGYATTEPTDDTISHLGGWPTWLDERTPPPGDLAKCKVCNNPMPLLLQLNGDLPEHFPDDERRLYIFGCPRKACSRKTGSIRALRGIRKLKVQSSPQPEKKQEDTAKQEHQTAPAPAKDLGAALFGAAPSSSSLSSNANPFSTSNSSAPANNPFAPPQPPSTLAAEPPQNQSSSTVNNLSETFADKARLSSPEPAPAPVAAGPPLPWPPQSAFPSPYPEYYLDAEYETLSRPSTPTIPANATVSNIDDEDTSKSGSAADSKDAFESSLDKSFLRFLTRLSHNPEQVLRYEFRGSPLLYSNTDAVGKLFPRHPSQISAANQIPRCNYCGRERVFELQLVPHAISVLEEGREGIGLGKDDGGMEWGTIILGVCAGDCGPEQEGVAGWREEWVGVQWEETK